MEPNCNGQPAPSPHAAARGEFSVAGMTCGNCARHVTEAIQTVPGVARVVVTLETQRASVQWAAANATNIPGVLEAVRQAGFEAKALEESPSCACAAPETKNGWRANLWIGALCLAPLLVGEWIFHLAATRWFQWLSFALAAVVQVFAGARFYRGAWMQLKVRRANMDALVSLGSTTAFGYSVAALLAGGAEHLYFIEAAAIITLISTGHWLEARMSQRAASSVKKLLALAPPQARRRLPDGTESLVPVAELQPGDTVLLRPGDSVPADARVLEGASALDESMLTGEAVPVDKAPGDTIYAGTANLNGQLAAQVTAAGEATALARIIAAVQRAQNSRASIQRLGDQVSSVFVPVVVLIALATAFWWGFAPESAGRAGAWLSAQLHLPVHNMTALAAAFVHAAAVLIVACPCAMGLATPAAIMAGANAAAEKGILIRDGIALEKAGTITSVIFDKTGTLTSGKPAVAQFTACPQDGPLRLDEKQLAASMARFSNHPLSQAVAKLHADATTLLNWEEVRGSGLQCQVSVDGRLAVARLGSLAWLRESAVDLGPNESFAAEWSGQGATVLGLSADQRLLALIALQDTLKPGVANMVQDLRRQGLQVYLLTGDHTRTAQALAQQVGIPADHVFAEVRPEQKAGLVQQLQLRGERVAFVGDGINDAPALEQADLGIAVSRASDIALEAADIILLRSDIQSVPESLGLARATLRTIKQNLFWAFFYNAVGIPLAALGLFSPVLCAAAMGVSDVVVIGNALRLRRWKPARRKSGFTLW